MYTGIIVYMYTWMLYILLSLFLLFFSCGNISSPLANFLLKLLNIAKINMN